jgi:hypothetical protein
MNKKFLIVLAASPLVLISAARYPGAEMQKRPKMNSLTITAHDFGFTAARRIPSGLTRIQFINNGGTIHHAQLLRFTGNHTVKDYVAALKPNAPPPSWATDVGGPNAMPPHGELAVIESLEPGNYGIVCFVDLPDHVPHIMKGMSRDLTVTKAGGNKSDLPEGDLSVDLVDYNFKWSAPVTAGAHRITVTTDAAQSHELTVIRLLPGKSANDMLGWLDKMEGPPPGQLIGGVAGLTKGKPVSVGLVFTPATYMLICFVPDMKDGKPHFMHGMVQEFTVQ